MDPVLTLIIVNVSVLVGWLAGAMYRSWRIIFGQASDGDLANFYNAAHDEMKRRGLI